MNAMKLLLPLAILSALAIPNPARAQHAGHVMPMPAPQPPATKKPAAKPVAKPAPKVVAKPSKKAPVAKPAPAKKTASAKPKPTPTAQPVTAEPSTMDHSQMEGMDHSTMQPAAKPQAIDHSKMNHSQMEGMDHSTMQPAPQPPASDHSKMNHSNMEGMDHSKMEGMDHSTMNHAMTPEVTPIPPLTQADREAAFPAVHVHHMHGTSIQSYWLLDRLEVSDADKDTALGWDAMGWIGGDVRRVWMRSEGEAVDGRIEHGDVEVLYGRSVRPWWDVLAGVRQDIGKGPSRTWAAFGVQGLAPYKFEVAATAYIGQGGHTALRAEAEYDTLLTNRLILQWRGEANAYGKDDSLARIGAGLSTVELGARLRFEITRQFAPYIGIEHSRAFGNTAHLQRLAGHGASDTRVVAGLRFWF